MAQDLATRALLGDDLYREARRRCDMDPDQQDGMDRPMAQEPVPGTRDALIEALAAIEHQRWADWQAWVHKCGFRESHGDPDQPPYLVLNGNRVEAWERQIVTSYADLSEQEQQSDREQVMRYWPLIVAFVAEWIPSHCGDFCDSDIYALADRWRQEMSQ
jgi:hypothetical protein